MKIVKLMLLLVAVGLLGTCNMPFTTNAQPNGGGSSRDVLVSLTTQTIALGSYTFAGNPQVYYNYLVIGQGIQKLSSDGKYRNEVFADIFTELNSGWSYSQALAAGNVIDVGGGPYFANVSLWLTDGAGSVSTTVTNSIQSILYGLESSQPTPLTYAKVTFDATGGTTGYPLHYENVFVNVTPSPSPTPVVTPTPAPVGANGTGQARGMGTRLVDVNGDGRPDLVQDYFPGNGDYGNQQQHKVWLNTGSGWAYDAGFSSTLAASDTFFTGSNSAGVSRDMGTRLIDVNGDGRKDLIQDYFPGNGDYSNQQQWKVWLNTGSGWNSNTGFATALAQSDMYFTGTDDAGQN
jgi:hypothetical protein